MFLYYRLTELLLFHPFMHAGVTKIILCVRSISWTVAILERFIFPASIEMLKCVAANVA